MSNLREKLQELTECGDLEKQVSFMEGLRKEFNHNIVLCQKFGRNVEKQYTCFMHGLDVPNAEEVKNILRRNHKIIFGTKFVRDLIDKGVLSLNETGSVLIYFRDNDPVHAGKFSYQTNRVISKWGIGHLWEHNLWEVPAFYGNEYKLFSPVEPKKIIKEFEEFAASPR